MFTTTQSPIVSSTNERGLRPTRDELCQNIQLLIQLRWAAGLGILSVTAFARYALDIRLQTAALMLIGVAVLLYNSLLSLTCRGDTNARQVERAAWGQMILDWGAMAALVHFTGGITSPALIYFVIHAALAGTVLLPWQARSLAVLATAIVIGIALTEREGILPHVAIPEFEMSGTLYQNGTYITGVVFFFGTAILTLSELVTRIAQRLRQREERIRQLYEARSTFLRVATHELRAPLGAGLSLMHNIQQGYAGEFTPEQGDILDRVTRRLEGLRTLIDDLLTLAASQEVTAAHVPLEPVGVCPILDRIVEREMPNAERKNIQLTCDKSTDAGVVMAGYVGLGIILGNLLNNAIKYTPEGGRVNVKYRLNRPAQRIEITVSDSGIGIPADDMPRLFDEFFRARNTKTLQVTGTGIGLSTVRTLLDRYHGHITIESEEGKGTTVHVTLPLALRYTLSDG